MNKRWIWPLFAVTALILSFSSRAMVWGQSQAATATVQGTIYDPTGAVVPDAVVTARHADTGFTRSARSNQHGYYVLPLLPTGEYTITVSAQGFAEMKFEHVILQVGDMLTLDAHLSPASIREEAVVVAGEEVPLIEPTRTQPGTVIDRTLIDNLPLNGRNWTELVLLTPGVTDADDFGNVSFGGADRVSNNIQVDGADNNNGFFGEIRGRTRAPFQFSQETVKEFRVAHNTFAAEYGRATGGIVNAITRSGTNEWHGSGFYYIRDDAFNANNVINKSSIPPIPRPDERRQQFGGNIGGPLIRDRLFFFLNYDQQVRDEPVGVILGPELENEIVTLPEPLRSQAQSFFFPLTGSLPRDFDQITFFPRIDWVINQNHTLTVTHNFQQFDSRNGVFTRPTTDDSVFANAKNFTNSYTSVITLNSVLSPRVINEFRFNFVFDYTGDFGNAPFMPDIRIRGFALGSRNFLQSRPGEFPGRFTEERRQQWIDGLSIVKGRHTFKVGLDINRVQDANFFALQVSGRFSFSSIADFLQGNFSSYQQRFFGPGLTPLVKQVSVDYGFYGQDTFRVNPRFTLYYGLRYDLQTLPDPLVVNPLEPRTGIINEDTNNFGPRFGFAITATEDGKTVVRGGYGIFYGRTPNLLVNDVLTNNNVYSFNVFLSADAAPQFGITFPIDEVLAAGPFNLPNIQFPRLEEPPGGFDPSDPFADLRIFAPDRVNPYFQKANLEIEREILPNTTVSIAYLFTKGTHISRVRNVNIIPPTGTATLLILSEDGRSIVQSMTIPRIGVTTVSLRPNPNFRQILMLESVANSVYHGLALRVNHRFSRGFALLASYTLSKSIDDIGLISDRNSLGGFSNLLDPFNSRLDRGLSDLDRTHRLVISGVWRMPFFKNAKNGFLRHGLGGWSLSGIARFATGRPFSAEAGGGASATDFNEDNVIFDRIPFFGRNTFRGPGQNQIDLSVRKRIRWGEKKFVEFIYQVFNIANHPQFSFVNRSMFDSRRTGGTRNRRFFLIPRNDFGQPLSARRNRDMQFGVKVSF
ncbi:MAG: TonB-dependent receptor [Acidobacteria bacterium]|nr:MAG: TonB-dependent receptor [Acidobacteriota bacterium]